MKRLFCLLLPGLLLGISLAQTPAPKREFRASWIATVKNIDWPSRAGLPTYTQQDELLQLLDGHQAQGLNAVIFQVQPAADAFYDTPFAPWSEWLTGEQGKAPEPYYDPLSFAVEACHERGIELHAWFNPFRAATDWGPDKQLSPDHIARKHPEWTLAYGKNLYLDPGIPAARSHVKAVILDAARRYELDAIHFDDYFYPYRIDTTAFPDTVSFARYGAGFPLVDDWRRDNINRFIQELHEELLLIRPGLQFGVSPFGVWRNQDKDPILGSDSRAGQTSYDDLYADIRLWLKEGWLDYVAPQLYWSIGYPPASFDKLLLWWNKNAFGRNVYIGQAAYKVANNHDSNWRQPSEIPRQISMIREQSAIHGSVFFSAKWFKTNPLGMTDSLVNHYYRHPALPPLMPWKDEKAPQVPIGLDTDAIKGGLALTWDASTENDHAYYVVYRAKGKELPSANPAYHHAVVWGNKNDFEDQDTRWLRKYTYLITSIDQARNESLPSDVRSRRRWR